MSKSGIYLLTNNDEFEILIEKLQILAENSYVAEQKNCAIELLQYRRKLIQEAKQKKAEVESLLLFCEQFGIQLIINDDVDLAREYEVGVHLGQSDGCLSAAREKLGQSTLIGRTCHQSIELAKQAELDGADYVAFGVYRKSNNKPNAKVVSEQLLIQARQELNVDICVIGGVTLSDIPVLKKQGVRYFAMIDALLAGNMDDIKIRAHQMKELYAESEAL